MAVLLTITAVALGVACAEIWRLRRASGSPASRRPSVDASNSSGDLLATVAHELRTPLAAIVLQADLLERSAGESAEISERVAAIQGCADRMQRLIDDLVDSATIDAGRFALVRRPLALPGVFEEAVGSLRALADRRGIAVELEPAGDLPPVDADRDRVLQVLTNLVVNAVHATPPGGRVRVSARAAERGHVEVSVEDTGIGIPPHEAPQLFDRFRRGSRAVYPGSGLGLSIAKGIIEAHGGRIWAESEDGGGSAFRFTLPEVDRPRLAS